MRSACLVAVLVCASGCGVKPASSVVKVDSHDPRMAKAIDKARSSIGEFTSALERPQPGQSGFSVKIPFPAQNGGHEHMWINAVSFDGVKFHGTISNRPERTTDVHLGDRVSATPEEISDWMYLAGRTLVGGYTIRAIRDNLSPAERETFDRQSPFIIQ
jgi:uncharacterized protein YegJ (DUF2314 family)